MSVLPDYIKNDIDRVFNLQLNYKYKSSSYKNRIQKLEKIFNWTITNRKKIEDAVYADFKKPSIETDISEIFTITSEIKQVKKKLKKWMKPRKVKPTLTMITTKCKVRFEPKGIVLIISPWNYPFMLAIEPLISALAAGNSVILKPSEISKNTSKLVISMINELFDESEVKAFEGDKNISQYLLSKPFDHIFFTGSTNIGKIVMKAAAEHLTSVTLELGGKSPVIVDNTADLDDAVGKIVWSKLFNAGQSCQAPDYVLIEESIKAEFILLIKKYLDKFYSNSDKDYRKFPTIINSFNFQRLKALISDALNLNAKIETGGLMLEDSNQISFTIISDVPMNSKIMKEEIFGPVLPVVTFKNISNAIKIINSNGKPLGIYIFSKNKKNIETILTQTTSGGSCINDLFIQFSHLNLPFGGVRESGMGNAHGFYGFRAFSNERAILKHHKYSPFKLFYPPYSKKTQKLVDFIIKYL